MESLVSTPKRLEDGISARVGSINQSVNSGLQHFGYANSGTAWKITLADLQILSLLEAIPMTGYGIKKYFLSYFGINISFGTLYPRLKYFEKLEIIKPTIVYRSRGTSGIYYELTAKGKTELELGWKYFQKTLELTRDLKLEP
jgi:DNA-binding PadR family transcriptional regulator